MCAYGFRHIPKDRRHIPEHYRQPAPLSWGPVFHSMPVIKFEPFEVIPTKIVDGRRTRITVAPYSQLQIFEDRKIIDASYNDAEAEVWRKHYGHKL